MKQNIEIILLVQTNLEGLYKCPEKNPNCISLTKKLDQPRCSKKPQEAHVYEVFLLRYCKYYISTYMLMTL